MGAALFGAWVGGVAPDLLEIPMGARRLLPHRRLTHWLAFWVAGVALSLSGLLPMGPLLQALCLGFFVGGVAHCLGDLPNPQGIPVLHPWNRSSLHWWPSGRHDFLLGFGSVAAAALLNPSIGPYLIHRLWG